MRLYKEEPTLGLYSRKVLPICEGDFENEMVCDGLTNGVYIYRMGYTKVGSEYRVWAVLLVKETKRKLGGVKILGEGRYKDQ